MFDIGVPTESFRSKIVDKILNEFENNIKYKVIGFSLCNRKIESFEFGQGNKKILFAGCFHGMEWITSLVLFKFIYEYHAKILNFKVMVIPCINPDGVEISLNGAQCAGDHKQLVEKIGNSERWQANARGVDINHNFDAGWKKLRNLETKNGIFGPSNTRYGGEFPESEPETKSIVNLCLKENYDQIYAFHSQGEEIYWSYGKNTPAESKIIADKIANLTGYKVGNPEGLAVGGGFKDWFIEKFEKPGFTIELGKGMNPLPLSDFEQIYQKIKNFLDLFAKN